jgi:hypothetical protein
LAAVLTTLPDPALHASLLPSDEAAAGLALSINRSGSTKIRTIVLLTPEQVDAAAKMAPEYRPPGT